MTTLRADDDHEKRNAIQLQRWVMPILQGLVLAALMALMASNKERDARIEELMRGQVRQEVLITQLLAEVSKIGGRVEVVQSVQQQRGPRIDALERSVDNYFRYYYGDSTKGLKK